MMTQTQPKPTTLYEQALRTQLSQLNLNGDLSAWEKNVRQTALNRFDELGLPHRRMEAWRFIDLGALLNHDFQPFQPDTFPAISLESLAPYLYEEASQSRLVFVNGFYAKELSQVDNLPAGAVITDLHKALSNHIEQVQPNFAQGLSDETDAFAALNTALMSQGAFIYLPDNVAMAQPIQCLFITQGDEALPKVAHPRLLVIAGQHAKVEVITTFMSLTDKAQSTFNNVVVELFAGEHAQLAYTHVQNESFNAYQMVTTRAFLQAHSQASLASVSLGGQLSRNNLEVKALGEYITCTLNGLSVLTQESQVNDHTIIEHQYPNGTSTQTYKGILDGRSRSEFDGIIIIFPGAQQTDATQLNRNLLLSDDARIFTRPQLKIDTDDVKCAHGATVGQLDEDQLFYLASRGLSGQTARNVLTFGFAEEIIDKLPVKSLRNHLMRLVLHHLNTHNPDEIKQEAILPWSN